MVRLPDLGRGSSPACLMVRFRSGTRSGQALFGQDYLTSAGVLRITRIFVVFSYSRITGIFLKQSLSLIKKILFGFLVCTIWSGTRRSGKPDHKKRASLIWSGTRGRASLIWSGLPDP